MFSYDCMRILLMMLDCAVVHSTATWVSNSLKGYPLVCNLGLQSFKGTYLATALQSWFIGVRFFKAEICPGSHSLRGYQWSLKDSGVRVGARIARGIIYIYIYTLIIIYIYSGDPFPPWGKQSGASFSPVPNLCREVPCDWRHAAKTQLVTRRKHWFYLLNLKLSVLPGHALTAL